MAPAAMWEAGLLLEQVSWDAEAHQGDDASLRTWGRELPELGETLKPTAVVCGFGEEVPTRSLLSKVRVE